MAQHATSTPSSTRHQAQHRAAWPDAAPSIRQAAALVLLASLAACGSGSGDSAEPASQLQTKAETAAAGQGTNGSDSNAQSATDGNQAGTPAEPSGNAANSGNDTAEQPASPVSAAAPLSDQGVRGDVVATALRTVGGAENGADSVTERILGGMSDATAGISRSKTDTHMANHVRRIHAAEGENAALGPFTWEDGVSAAENFNYRAGIAKTHLVLGLSAIGTLPDDAKNAAADAEMVQIGAQARFTFPEPFPGYAAVTPTDETRNYQAEGPVSIRKDTVYAYDADYVNKGAIQTWHATDRKDWVPPESIAVMVVKSSLENSFQLCMKASEYKGSRINRLDCDTWEVPSGWTPGQALVYKGHNLSIQEKYDYPITNGSGDLIGTEPAYRQYEGQTEALKNLQAQTSSTEASGAEASNNAGTPSDNTGNATAASDGKATHP